MLATVSFALDVSHHGYETISNSNSTGLLEIIGASPGAIQCMRGLMGPALRWCLARTSITVAKADGVGTKSHCPSFLRQHEWQIERIGYCGVTDSDRSGSNERVGNQLIAQSTRHFAIFHRSFPLGVSSALLWVLENLELCADDGGERI